MFCNSLILPLALMCWQLLTLMYTVYCVLKHVLLHCSNCLWCLVFPMRENLLQLLKYRVLSSQAKTGTWIWMLPPAGMEKGLFACFVCEITWCNRLWLNLQHAKDTVQNQLFFVSDFSVSGYFSRLCILARHAVPVQSFPIFARGRPWRTKFLIAEPLPQLIVLSCHPAVCTEECLFCCRERGAILAVHYTLHATLLAVVG